MSRAYDVLAPIINCGVAAALLLVLALLIRGPFKRYWIVFVYAAWELLATLGFTIADLMVHGTARTGTAAQQWYARAYWTNDVLVDLFRFVLVIVLIHRASEGSRRVSGWALAALVALVMVLPFVLFELQPRIVQIGSYSFPFARGSWFNSTSELLNFGAAIMNLMLWATLIASKKRDPVLLGVSLGLGIVVTGTALAYGVRHLMGQREFAAVGYIFMNLTQLAGWAMWCRTFARAPRQKPLAQPMVPSS
ncbi:MAG: hypothetical protein LAO79_18625 [Acidobacteriia bacterium]|nr:hypothetical protein [Terriglobia bacterium]